MTRGYILSRCRDHFRHVLLKLSKLFEVVAFFVLMATLFTKVTILLLRTILVVVIGFLANGAPYATLDIFKLLLEFS